MFLRNSIVSLLLYAGTTLLSLGLSVAVARTLGPEGSGVVALLTLFSVIIVSFGNFGLGQAAVYHIGRATYPSLRVANNLFTVTWALGILICSLLLATIPLYADRFFRGIPRTELAIVIAITPFALGKLYAEYIFAGIHDFWWSGLLNVIELALRLCLVLVLLNHNFHPGHFVYIMFISTAASCLLGWGKIFGKLSSIKFSLNGAMLWRFVSYGFPSYGSVLITFLNLRLDQFLIALFLPVDQLGLYGAAVIVAELPMKVANAVTKVLFSKISGISGQDATIITSRLMRFIATLALITALFLVFTGPVLIRVVFGNQFQGATYALLLLLPGAVFFNFTQILYSDLLGRGRPVIGLYAGLCSLAVTVVGNIMLTPSIGIVGAAAASSLSYFAGATVLLVYYLRLTGERLSSTVFITLKDITFTIACFREYRRA